METITLKRLTPSAFSPFGEVLLFDPMRSKLVNDGRALRSDTSARFDTSTQTGTPVLAVYRAQGEALPLHVKTFERHPLSSQAFIALSAELFLVVVAPEDASNLPDFSRAEAFLGYRGEGVNYTRNVWHAPITAIDADGDFLMFMWESGRPEDCIFHYPPEPLLIRGLDTLESQVLR